MEHACPARIKLRWPWWGPLVVLLALICFVGPRHATPPAVLLPWEEPQPPLLASRVNQAWEWLKFHLPGHRPNVLMRAKIFQWKQQTNLVEPPFGQATVSSNTVQVWVVDEPALASAAHWFQQNPQAIAISQPGIQTASGTRGSMVVGSTVLVNGQSQFAGLELNTFPKAHQDQVDLRFSLKFTEPITNLSNPLCLRTNLAVRSRVQIPARGGVLFLSNDTNRPPVALLLSATVQ
jgi:hypothetical protein